MPIPLPDILFFVLVIGVFDCGEQKCHANVDILSSRLTIVTGKGNPQNVLCSQL